MKGTVLVIDSQTYRDAMRHKTDAVCIVATGWRDERAGLTATSVCSLSDAPPTLLVCVNRETRAHDMICSAKKFSVNLLTADQCEVAQLFSGASPVRGDARFRREDWQQTDDMLPVLADALAVFECKLVDQHVFATHSIFIGNVMPAHAQGACDPLIYLRGDFRAVT